MVKKTVLIVGLVAILLVVFSINSYSQCATCKAVAESDLANGGTAAKGINQGILYLMGIPYLLLFLVFRKKLVSFYKQFTGLWKI